MFRKQFHFSVSKTIPLSGLILSLLAVNTLAQEYEQAKRIHERLTGTAPTEAVLESMEDMVSAGDGIGAAEIAMDPVQNPNAEAFLSATLKRMAAPWTNRDFDPYVPLDDYIATYIGYVLDDRDIRGLLYEDVVYHMPGVTPAYSPSNNSHYETIENNDEELTDLVPVAQSSVNPGVAPAGIMTTRSAAEAFFILGTNRAMLRFTLVNHLCTDLEQMEDINGVPDRIRQDVSRSPGGDSELFTRGCVGCHTGMDPLAQAFAYYNYDEDQGRLIYHNTPQFNPVLEQYNPGLASYETRVDEKYFINGANFNDGYITPDDSWDNYWREGKNAALQWDWGGDGAASGQGAASMGRALANSYAFASCQVKKVFKAICLRDPVDDDDQQKVIDMTNELRDQQGWGLRDTFAKTADYCKDL